jgi:hypothetical protein
MGKSFMNSAFVFCLCLVLLGSCKKEDITPGNYKMVPEPMDTSDWQSQYTNGGVTPIWDTQTINNHIFGTNWVLIDVYTNYAHIDKNDTIHFISNTKYTIGSDTTKYTYVLSSTMGNSSLQLNTFIPINGLTLSCSNFWSGTFTTTPVGGTVQLLLKDVFSTTTYTSTLKKI